MLGVRLRPSEEALLDRTARDLGRPKSALAREWIIERLERESIDARVRTAAAALARNDGQEHSDRGAATTAWLQALDDEDGGYDWGPEGPPE